MKSFDEWFNSHEDRIEWDDAPPIAVDAFEAGQQSKQAEVNELQKRIDEAMEIPEYNEYVDSPLQALNILKGNKNEN